MLDIRLKVSNIGTSKGNTYLKTLKNIWFDIPTTGRLDSHTGMPDTWKLPLVLITILNKFSTMMYQQDHTIDQRPISHIFRHIFTMSQFSHNMRSSSST